MLRKVGVLVLFLALTLLAAGAAQARPLVGSSRATESHGLFARLMDWVESFFQRQSVSTGQPNSIWAQDGSHIDPNGGG